MTNLMNVEVKMKAKEKLSMKLLIMRRRNKKKVNPFSAKRNIVCLLEIYDEMKDEFCKNHKKQPHVWNNIGMKMTEKTVKKLITLLLISRGI